MKNLIVYFTFLLCLCSCDAEFASSSDPGLTVGIQSGDAGSVSVGGENYGKFVENDFINVLDEEVSTFSIDADGGSYSNVRDLINLGQELPNGAVRIEELINYFQYDYEAPDQHAEVPIGLSGEITTSPWNEDHHILRIGIKGKNIPTDDLPPSNIVLLVDVSGSMASSYKLDLAKDAFDILVDQLDEDDHIAIVTYGRSSEVWLESTRGDEKAKIKDAIKALSTSGSTNGESGIRSAYDLAEATYREGGNNRIIIASDGAFNVGISSVDDLTELITEKKESNVFLTTLGFGRGNYNDQVMEQIANKGNGTYEYIDSKEQAEKVFSHEWNKFFTVAEDVKVQVEFNSNVVEQYRLIGYENRLLTEEDFEDDEKDAGEIGANQSVTALYELKLKNDAEQFRSQRAFQIQFRYKDPLSDQSELLTLDVKEKGLSFEQATESTRFATAVAGFGMMLIDSKYKGDLTYDKVRSMVKNADSYNPYGYKTGLLDLIDEVK